MVEILSENKIRKNTLYKALINKERIVSHEDSTTRWAEAQLR